MLDTLNNFVLFFVKILAILDNPRITNARSVSYKLRITEFSSLSMLVGISEAIRLLSTFTIYIKDFFISFKNSLFLYTNSLKDICDKENISTKVYYKKASGKHDERFFEWLAGVIDGDGCFSLSKKGYASLEITVDIRDEHALHIIKNVYGGSIKLRSGANSIRYRLHHKSGLLSLINDVNGLIRNSNRLIQLNKICQKYELNLILPENLTYYNGWLSGIFDSEGCISINKTNTQLSISVSQKTSELLKPLVDLYKGNIYIDNGSLKSFKWYITKREDILSLVEYFKKHPSRSAKKNRLHLIPKYYELKDLKADKALPDTLLAKSWKYFQSKWLKYEDSN